MVHQGIPKVDETKKKSGRGKCSEWQKGVISVCAPNIRVCMDGVYAKDDSRGGGARSLVGAVVDGDRAILCRYMGGCCDGNCQENPEKEGEGEWCTTTTTYRNIHPFLSLSPMLCHSWLATTTSSCAWPLVSSFNLPCNQPVSIRRTRGWS